MEGRVLSGTNNIYTVETDDRMLQCRIKGKVLKTGRRYYNPIAVGDLVAVQADPFSPQVGWIVKREERSTSLVRWNRKREALQVMAANADLVVGVTSAASPPFRPRFVDRLIVSGESGGLEAVVLVNKCDLGLGEEAAERIRDFRRIGYRVVLCSALTGEGLEELGEVLRGQTAVFCGQSGVGKSSILNRLVPELELAVGKVSAKYDRGAHTTSFSRMIHWNGVARLVDTPGIRELEIAGIRPQELHHFFREFQEHAPRCAYYACLHIDEPDCAVQRALEEGAIHPDRYESYLRIYDDLVTFYSEHHGSAYP